MSPRAPLAGLLLGVLVGVAARYAHTLPGEAYWLASLGGPWLAAAFAAGALARTRGEAIAAGAVAIVAGTLAYYSVFALHHAVSELSLPTQGMRYGAAMAVAWSAAGLAIGGGFGAAGFVWRRGGRSVAAAAGAAALAGALIGEALLLQAIWDASWAQPVLAAELIAGVAAVLLLARGRRATALALTPGFAIACLAFEAAVRETLRAAGWAGA